MNSKNAYKLSIKLVCLSLAAVLVLSAAACSADKTDGDIQTESVSSSESSSAAESETLPRTELPQKDFGGDTFRVFMNWSSDYFTNGFDADKITGEPVNDTIYNRDSTLEKQYNVDIVGEKNSDLTVLSKAIMAGDDSYSACYALFGMATLITNDLLLDFGQVPNADLSKPWWDSYINDVYSIAGKQFIVSSDMDVTTIYHARVLFFNKQLLGDLQLDDPYALVNGGTWTLDKFTAMCKAASKDLNGDGEMNFDDQWGYAVQTGITINMYYALGQDFIAKDDKGIPYLSVGDEKSVTALQKLASIFADKSSVMFDSDYAKINPKTHEVIQQVFSENRALFLAEIVQLAERMRAAEIDFGILPQPKYDENQDRYYCFVECGALGVPVSNDKLEMTGILMEEIAYYNYAYLRPEIYETCLKSKYTRDEESKAMLDIIFANRMISLENVFRWGIQDAMQTQMNSGKEDFASAIERVRKSVEDKMQQTINVYTGVN
jgi:ABC-type sugar transport system, periplasmic component